MSHWLDITRDLPTGTSAIDSAGSSVFLFKLENTLYTLIRILNGTPSTFRIYKHLGSDPPVVDSLWSAIGDFPRIAQGSQYNLKGWIEDPVTKYVYILDEGSGTVFRNTTAGIIDTNWEYIIGPFGSPDIVGSSAGLFDITLFQNTIYISHTGGVSKYNPDFDTWTLVGTWLTGSNGKGVARALQVFNNELYVGIAFKDIGIIYKFNDTVDDIDNWIKVAELPLTSLDPWLMTLYNNDRIIIGAKDVNQNIFSTRNIDITLNNSPQFINGIHLKGVPLSIITYSKDGSVWLSVAENEFASLGYFIGDVDGNNTVNTDDLSALADFLISAETLTNVKAADVNNDGTVNIVDFVALTQHIAGTVDYGAAYDIPINTVSANKITSLSTISSSETAKSTFFDYNQFNIITAFNSFTPVSTSILSEIIFPSQTSTPYTDPTIVRGWSSKQLNEMSSHATFDTNNILPLDELKTYTVSCDVSVIPAAGMKYTGGPFGNDTSNITQFSISMGLTPLPNSSSVFWKDFFNTQIFTPAQITRLPADQFVFDKHLTFTFKGTDLRQTPLWIGNNPGVRIRVVLQVIHWDDIDTGHFATDVPFDTSDWRLFRPEIRIKNLEINVIKSIFPDTVYIVKSRKEIPSNDLNLHTTSIPSGPDEWFTRFYSTQDSTNLLWPPTISPNFVGDAIYRLVTNPIDFEAGKTYDINCIVRAPQGSTHPINVEIISPNISTNRTLVNFKHLGIPTGSTSTDPYKVSTSFMVPADATSDEITNIPITFDIIENNVTPEKVGDDILISDINITEKITGNSTHRIYRYNGQAWEDSVATKGLHDAVASNLTEVYDLASSEYQLYCLAKGRVFVWHYPGGRYSGSAAGVSGDIRPQIINIL